MRAKGLASSDDCFNVLQIYDNLLSPKSSRTLPIPNRQELNESLSSATGLFELSTTCQGAVRVQFTLSVNMFLLIISEFIVY